MSAAMVKVTLAGSVDRDKELSFSITGVGFTWGGQGEGVDTVY